MQKTTLSNLAPFVRAGLPALLALLASCGGGGGTAIAALEYGEAVLRVGEPIAVSPTAAPTAGGTFSVDPPLPAGLTLDTASGAVTGTPTTSAARSVFTVSWTDGVRTIEGSLSVSVGAELPAEVLTLEDGFEVERFAQLPQPPGKCTVAPDGRVFVTELMTGSIRVVDPDGTLRPTPFATEVVENGGHQGLLGIALSPDFVNDGLVYAMAVVPAAAPKPVRSQLLRWRDQGSLGTDRTVLLDDLPASAINNGGALLFDASGMLLVSIGDNEDPALAQDDGSLAGKLLRVNPSDGSIPSDNPSPASLIFAKGLRNTYALAKHPSLDALYGADNGPASDDELNLMQPGRNYEWGGNGQNFGAVTGAQLRHWPDVVVPTGLASAGDHLYVGLYDEELVERWTMSGALRTDIDDESEFLRFTIQGNDNKPLDLQLDAQGDLFVLTFAAIYRVRRISR